MQQDRIELVKCVDTSGVESQEVMLFAYLSSIFHTARKSPLDTAIQVHGKMDSHEYEKIDEVPFDFERRRDSIVVDHGAKRLMITKGAPESILAISSQFSSTKGTLAMTPTHSQEARAEYDALSADGFRVLAVAVKEIHKDDRINFTRDEEEGMTFLGFAAFLDPPKESARTALGDLAKLSIGLKIITGDSEVLTQRICRDI